MIMSCELETEKTISWRRLIGRRRAQQTNGGGGCGILLLVHGQSAVKRADDNQR